MIDRPTFADTSRQLGAGLFFLAGAGSYVFIVVLTAQKHGLHADNAKVLGVVYAPLVFGQLVFAFRYLYRFQVSLGQRAAARPFSRYFRFAPFFFIPSLHGASTPFFHAPRCVASEGLRWRRRRHLPRRRAPCARGG